MAKRETLTGVVLFKITATTVGFFGNSGVFTDERDDKVYKWVRIGKQAWMAENLNVGVMIKGKKSQKDNGRIEKYCYGDKENNCITNGGLYQWDAAMQYVTTEGVQGICPSGWHIPTNDEWDELIDFLGGSGVAGGKMKEAGYDHWNSPNTGATNSSDFTAFPGGYRGKSSGSFYDLGNYGSFWSSSQSNASNAWGRDLSYNNGDVYRGNDYKTNGFSVRCLQD